MLKHENKQLMKADSALAFLEILNAVPLPPDVERSLIGTLKHYVQHNGNSSPVGRAAYALAKKLRKDLNNIEAETASSKYGQSYAKRETKLREEMMKQNSALVNAVNSLSKMLATKKDNQNLQSDSKYNHLDEESSNSRQCNAKNFPYTSCDSSYVKKSHVMLKDKPNNFVIPTLASKTHELQNLKSSDHRKNEPSSDKGSFCANVRKKNASAKNHTDIVHRDSSEFKYSAKGYEQNANHKENHSLSDSFNGQSHSANNYHNSTESSHLHNKRQLTVPESKKVQQVTVKNSSCHEKDSSKEKYLSPVNSPTYTSPDGTQTFFQGCKSNDQSDLFSFYNQKQDFSLYNSPYRPSSSSCGSNGDMGEDKSLSEESKYLMIDTAENSGSTDPEKHSKSGSPYALEIKQGMFKTVYAGSEPKVLHIKETVHREPYLSGRSYSWGWCIEKRNLSPSKKASNIAKDSWRKRKLDHDKLDSVAPTPKSQSLSLDEYRQRLTNCRDAKSNGESSSKVSSEGKGKPGHSLDQPAKMDPPALEKEIKLNKLGKSVSPEKLSKVSKCSPVHQSPASSEKVSHQEKRYRHAESRDERRRTPVSVPSSDGNAKVPRIESDTCNKSSKVIDDATMGFISSKKDRRTIYSGKKTAHDVMPLKLMCIDFLKKNIQNMKIEKTISFEVLKPVLEICNPHKLHKVEEKNQYLQRWTGYLWEKFYKTEFRDQPHTDVRNWKDAYWRARNKRENKLKSLTASISNGMAKAQPERQAKLMGVDDNDPEKRQKKMKVEEPVKIESNGKSNSSGSSVKSNESESSNSPTLLLKTYKISKPPKKTVAPLMSKTKKMMNFVNRRR